MRVMKRVAPSRQLLAFLSSGPSCAFSTQPSARAICSICRHRLSTKRYATPLTPFNSCLSTHRSVTSAAEASATGSKRPRDPLLAPDISNHYSIFPNTLPRGPPPAGPFNIHLPSLRGEFLQLQGRSHPDKFPPEQKAKAEALSARINEAYKALKDPLVRAQYVLSHFYGIDVTSEDNSSHPADPATLMQVMEAQESIEQAETEEQVAALKEQNEERIEAAIALLDDAFAKSDSEAARVETIRLRYWASLAEGLDAWNGKGSEVRLQH